jgi:hypothetical protein
MGIPTPIPIFALRVSLGNGVDVEVSGVMDGGSAVVAEILVAERVGEVGEAEGRRKGEVETTCPFWIQTPWPLRQQVVFCSPQQMLSSEQKVIGVSLPASAPSSLPHITQNLFHFLFSFQCQLNPIHQYKASSTPPHASSDRYTTAAIPRRSRKSTDTARLGGIRRGTSRCSGNTC